MSWVVKAYASLCFPMQHSASIFIMAMSAPPLKCFSTIWICFHTCTYCFLARHCFASTTRCPHSSAAFRSARAGAFPGSLTNPRVRAVTASWGRPNARRALPLRK